MAHHIVGPTDGDPRRSIRKTLIRWQPHEQVTLPLAEGSQGADNGGVQLQARLHAELTRHQPRQLDLEPRRGRLGAGKGQIGGVGTHAERAAGPDGAEPTGLRPRQPRGQDQHDEHTQAPGHHSNNPKTTNVPPMGILRRYWKRGSLPIRKSSWACDPPVTTATYCLPPCEKVMGGAVTGEPSTYCQTCAPLVASRATSLPSWVPTKTSPPPVAIAPPA